ncbi:ribosome maturation factor RimP [Zooshikella harenae]|uniref:Ribosome maturation factor RimP n=1 Tax=Zooshikella harenae TaxID=2827238 RepID=A0ABS5Z962_9GAMM|nr:ribosome maturation factor RimP [Zooshikella harenae]MBU2710585.1 ribosome maturation factor RimP [Zooshikella harenae]
MASKHQTLEQLIVPTIEALGFVVWGIELFSQGKHSKLQVFIDSPKGINLDDCEKVSRQISSILDVEDPISGEYTLEVSSPGMDRPLFTLAHYEAFKGHKVQLKLRSPYEGRRKFKGVITGVENDEVVVQVEDHEYLFAIDLIEKANIIPQF